MEEQSFLVYLWFQDEVGKWISLIGTYPLHRFTLLYIARLV